MRQVQPEVWLQPVPHRPPILRRRLHHHFAHLLMLQPRRQMLPFAPRRAELPLRVADLPVPYHTNHNRQHLLVHINARDRMIYWLHNQTSWWLVPAEDRYGKLSHPHRFSRRHHQDIPLISPFRGPRSNTRTASPYPVRTTTLAAAPTTPFSYRSLPRRGAKKHSCVLPRDSSRRQGVGTSAGTAG